MVDKVPVTLKGYETLQAELKNLKSVERPAVIQAIAEAREHGDLSENAEYHAAREKQSFIEGRILELEDKTSRADVIDPSKMEGETIRFGATVTVVDCDTDEEKEYQIVGELEADINNGKISLASPLAKGLIGKSAGDAFELHTPGGSKEYEIEEVKYI
ncbi:MULTISPECIES: transcription elongation factor GreA [Curvivirga]|uniref:transcription elongation factor GreA n=1 Tax=Curvivirga TaxID=2856846 RepID=UPI0012BD3622|nr:transcription elongation factor GreA [Curvivirga aplysinae]MTI08723.1 transcription elongation factor GreA [Curvivirga aplysinae]